MSDPVQIALITALATALPIMFQHWLTQRAIRNDLVAVKADVKTIEKATNSMKDALVLATEKEALGRGKAAGLIEGALQEKAYPTSQPAPAPSTGGSKKLKAAIVDLTEAAKDTVVSAEETVTQADKIPRT